jgi:hypothetical protein
MSFKTGAMDVNAPARPRGQQYVRGPAAASLWRSVRLQRLLLLAAIGPALQSPCPDGSERPVLHDIQPRNLTWRGGVVTITGAFFAPGVAVSIRDGSGRADGPPRPCPVLAWEDAKLTCEAPPSDISPARVSADVGGCESAQALSLDYVGWRWQDGWRWRQTPDSTAGSLPSPRMGHSLSADGYGNLILYGGLADAGVLGDVWMLRRVPPEQQQTEEQRWSWTPLQPRGQAPPPRAEHVAGVVSGRLYVFGGWNAMTTTSAAGAADSGLGSDGSAVSFAKIVLQGCVISCSIDPLFGCTTARWATLHCSRLH